jgi:hypothetical protein
MHYMFIKRIAFSSLVGPRIENRPAACLPVVRDDLKATECNIISLIDANDHDDAP